ncbi:conserved hypothetical protein [Halorhabdus utahensis DSM 12940]|uniref:Beta propeller domain protein n=1 Tax=Halorhabdus utahensis (strain DSM 12940 / JCM 11049 / AX-2) TaxID=519442 RepID=C7NMI7_HALUD|nr:beta-propeller domain-containing protein [Halorhabdus utahensis]ACV12626.1 conserved hypothetical protein [Halorhabdus utahensis DSM 12940]
MNLRSTPVIVAVILAVMVVGVSGFVLVADDPSPPIRPAIGDTDELATFPNEGAFQQYVRAGQSEDGTNSVAGVRTAVRLRGPPVSLASSGGTGAVALDSAASGSTSDVERHSSTNVQEAGIDEPDWLKTTGERLYYSAQGEVMIDPVMEDDEVVDRRRYRTGRTHVFDTSDPGTPDRTAVINASGRLLRTDDRLVAFEHNRLVGYDVSEPADPREVWSHSLNGSVVSARLLNGTVYLLTETPVSPGDCTIEPLGGEAGITCTDVYRPGGQIDVDVTYTALSIDPGDGTVSETESVVGSAGTSAVYMSSDAMYLTYTQRTSRAEIAMAALEAAETPGWFDDRLAELRSYDLSTEARMTELRKLSQRWLSNMSDDQMERTRAGLENATDEFVMEHRRKLIQSGIVRIGTDGGLAVDAVGSVPGVPLDQFSMDQHNGTLRIATTMPRQSGTESVNDLYTLDSDSLERVGSVQGMGIDERVYSVRYVDETGYVVTYRQVDPFHVVDLSDPAEPEEVGTLELPGYSSYLHPVDDDHVLGVGREDRRVKAVLFDVSDPSDPTIDDTYYPEASWSAISESHHAFLLDSRHEVFFLPTSEGGTVVSYTDGSLTERTTVSVEGGAQRAAYIDDFLYFVGDEQLVVVDETDWSRTATVPVAD